jgi:autotransporter-associated beta strand protein
MQLTKIFRTALLTSGIFCLDFVTSQAASIFKADVSDNLNLGSSWSGGTPPDSSDIAVWDNRVQLNPSATMGANLSWAGIQILDPAALITINSGNNLTLGASGIDLSLATTGLTLNNSNVLGANQTWAVANGQTLTVAGGVSGAAAVNKTGAGTLILSGVSSYSGGTLVSGGILQVGIGTGAGTGAITNTDGVTFRLNTSTTLANAFNFTGTVTLDLNNVGNNQGIGSPGAISGSGTVNFINQNTAAIRTFTLGGSSSSMANFSGTMNFGASTGFFRFNDGGGSGNTGSSSATFNLGTGTVAFSTRNKGASVNFGALFGGPNTRITNGSSSSGTSIYSVGGKNIPCQFDGTINDAGAASAGVGITKVGNSALTLTGTNTYIGATTVSAGSLIIGNGGTSGTLGVGPVVNNATLVFNRSDNFGVSNGVSGSGTLLQQGAGVLTYYGTNTSSGTLAVSSGTTVAVGASGVITGPIFIGSGASFDITANPAFAFNQAVSGFGTVIGAATNIGGSINPGGAGAAGTLSFANGLTEAGTVVNQMELSSPGGTNDLINVTGDLSLAGTNSIVISHFGSGPPPLGVYTLFTYSGNLIGGLTNLSVTVSGVTPTLTNPPNHIAVILTAASRGPTNLTWVGDGGANAWDTVSSNWVNGATVFAFQSGDSVRFDSTGAANPTVNLNSPAPLSAAAVVVDAANTYTFAGSGSIDGTGGLTKTNTGTLSVQTTNSYPGPTIVGQGTLEITNIANGNFQSSIGISSSDPTNLVLIGSTLRYVGGNAGTDRGATLRGTGGTVENPSGANLTFTTAPLTGPGALTKTGAGTLTLDVPNTYQGGTVLSNGVLALGANSANYDGGTGSGLGPTNAPVTFYGGTLQLFGYGGSTGNNFNTCFNPLIVPAGQTGTLRMFPRGPSNSGANSGLGSSLTGAGTLNLVVNYVRDSLDGDWSAFTGIINVTPKNATGDEFRINNSFGLSNATVILNDNVLMDRATTANATIDIGELDGTGGAVIGQGNSSAAAPTWRVGWKNTSSIFAGTIANDCSLTKVGSGTLTLQGSSTSTGTITISNGVLALSFNPTNSADGSIGSGTIDVTSGTILDVSGRSDGKMPLNSGQILRGRGTVLGILDNTSGGMFAPGGGPGGNVGTLTATNTVNLGGTVWMKLNRASTPNSDRLVSSLSSVDYGGTLVATNIGAKLQPGDTFTLFSGTALNNAFSTVVLPNYYTWDTSQLSVNGSIRVTGVLPPPSITHVDFSTVPNAYITLSATNGAPNGQVIVRSTQDLTAPWTPISTNNFDPNGELNGILISIDSALPQQFFRLQGL